MNIRGQGRARVLAGLAAVAVAGTVHAPAAVAAPFDVGTASLTWHVPHEATPGTGTLSNYVSTIGHGGVTASAPATGGPITSSSTPAPGSGVTVPFVFPGTSTGLVGTYDPATKTGSLQFEGTLTFTAHDDTFFSVVNPKLQFDAPQSVRLVANGKTAGGTVGAPGPSIDYGTTAARQTVFALNGIAAVTTANPDGSYTITGLAPSGVPANSPTNYLSTSGPFDGIRTWFGIDRQNQLFSVTFAEQETVPGPPSGSTDDLEVTGTVGDQLHLELDAPTASLGTFALGVAANYDATVTGKATSTGPSELWVHDDSSTPGRLVNGTTPLANPLQLCATTAAAPTCSYDALGAAPLQLLSLPAGSAATPLTIGLRQSIGASEPLTTGTYGKTLTFTLAAGTP